MAAEIKIIIIKSIVAEVIHYMGLIWGLNGAYMGVIWGLNGGYMGLIWGLYGAYMGLNEG